MRVASCSRRYTISITVLCTPIPHPQLHYSLVIPPFPTPNSITILCTPIPHPQLHYSLVYPHPPPPTPLQSCVPPSPTPNSITVLCTPIPHLQLHYSLVYPHPPPPTPLQSPPPPHPHNSWSSALPRTIIITRAVISSAPYLSRKGEHTAIYKISINVYIKPQKEYVML